MKVLSESIRLKQLDFQIFSIREALNDAYINKSKYIKLSQLAQNRANTEFSYTAIAKKTYDFIQEIKKSS